LDNELVEKNSNFIFIYLPSYYRFKNHMNFCKEKILELLNKNQIYYIDIHKEFFQKLDNPLSFFPFEKFGHYTIGGYKEITNIIYNKLY